MAKKEIDVDELMVPGNWKLKKTCGAYHVTFADEELDPIDVEFNGDGCASIKTMGYTHLTISSDDLRRLADMVDEAERRYGK